MLKRKPIGANQKATARWEATNRMTIEIFKAFWQKVGPHLEFPLTQAGDDASYAEWEDEDGFKYQGMRKADGAMHGIVRTFYSSDGCIEEATYCEDKLHGLCFFWGDYDWAFVAIIYDHGEKKAIIMWKSDWVVLDSEGDKELILENNGLSIFKP